MQCNIVKCSVDAGVVIKVALFELFSEMKFFWLISFKSNEETDFNE